MKSFTDYLTFNIPSKMAFVNITAQVAQAVKKSGVTEGLVLVNTMHITSSVFVNDNESGASPSVPPKWCLRTGNPGLPTATALPTPQPSPPD